MFIPLHKGERPQWKKVCGAAQRERKRGNSCRNLIKLCPNDCWEINISHPNFTRTEYLQSSQAVKMLERAQLSVRQNAGDGGPLQDVVKHQERRLKERRGVPGSGRRPRSVFGGVVPFSAADGVPGRFFAL